VIEDFEVDLIVMGEPLDRPGVTTELLGHEENVLSVSARAGKTDLAREFCLDHDENDRSAMKYFRAFPKGAPARIQRRYLDEAYSLIDGVALGLGWAILPRHLIESRRDIRVIKPAQKLLVPVYLQYWASPYRARLQEAMIREIRDRANVVLRNT
jgi:DNA-binding transcriptional LysR family regulator